MLHWDIPPSSGLKNIDKIPKTGLSISEKLSSGQETPLQSKDLETDSNLKTEKMRLVVA